MKKERVDALINKAKILKEVITNPLQSQREIAENAGVGKTTVQEHLKELNTTKDDRILGICDTDIEIVKLGQAEIHRRLKDFDELKAMKTSEISQVIKENTARYALFKGSATDEEGGLKIALTDSQLQNIVGL